MASYYAHKFHGRPTASGEIYDETRLTAAHPVLPFGTLVRVTNLNNNNSVVLKVNDRGPSSKGRIIDVSFTAASELGFVRQGVAKVKVEVVKSD
jgi:rare lipoprotein A